MKTKDKTPQTLQEAIVYFSDPERAFVYAVNLRWPDGVITCPRCGNDKHSFVKTRLLWFCKGCKKQFTVKVGSIFEDSPIGLDKWMTAVWMIVNCKNGISSWEIHHALGVTQKTAWFMLHRIREALKPHRGTEDMGGPSGTVEADETFIGGKKQFMHKSRKQKMEGMAKNDAQWRSMQSHFGKTPVVGLFDRETRSVRARVVPNVKRYILQQEILKNITKGSTICTDDLPSYKCLPLGRFVHEVVDHEKEYVRGQVHTNGLENFWSLLKRGLKGTYVAVEPFHLDRYVDEQVFRFNHRKDGEHVITDSSAVPDCDGPSCWQAPRVCRAHWQGCRRAPLVGGKDAVSGLVLAGNVSFAVASALLRALYFCPDTDRLGSLEQRFHGLFKVLCCFFALFVFVFHVFFHIRTMSGKRRRKHKLPKRAQPRPSGVVRNWYKHLGFGWKVLIFALGMPSLYIGCVSMSSRVSLTPGDVLRAKDPLSSPIIVSNEGYLPIHDAMATCLVKRIVAANGATVTDAVIGGDSAEQFVGDLGIGGKTTISCSGDGSSVFSMGTDKYIAADIGIVLSYRPDFFPWHRHKSFNFHARISDDGKIHWTPMAR